MKTILCGGLLLAFLSAALAEDATCGAGESETTVTIGAGDIFNYKTSARGKYKDNVNCVVNYLMDESCAEMKFYCKKINIKNKKNCSKGDTLVISTEDEEKVICGRKKKFTFTSTSDMVVEFTSDSSKRGGGAKGCKVSCNRAATTATTTTTAGPSTTTAGPTTTTAEVPTTTSAVFTPSPCFDGFESILACTTGDLRRRMESAVSECEQYFVTTTIVAGRSDTVDQERQADCQTLLQVEENFNMTMQASICVLSTLGWLDDRHQTSLTDLASLRPGLMTEAHWLEVFTECQASTEASLRESYAGCDYTGEDWSSLERIIQLSAYIQCSSQFFSQECESALTENFNLWLQLQLDDQHTTTPSNTETTEECEANTGDVCYDSLYDISKTCCQPAYCISQNNRTSVCQEFN